MVNHHDDSTDIVDDDYDNYHHEEAVVSCDTTTGPIVMRFYRNWSPNGYDRAIELFERSFFDHSHFFRVLPYQLVQFGISYSLDTNLQQFAKQRFLDDSPYQRHRRRDNDDDFDWTEPPLSFDRGVISFAGYEPHSRTCQLFITYASNEMFGREPWEIPIGKVTSGMNYMEDLYSYGDGPPWGNGPTQANIHNNPNYIPSEYPQTDSFRTCTVTRFDQKALVTAKLKRQQEGEETERIQTLSQIMKVEQEQQSIRMIGLTVFTVLAALLVPIFMGCRRKGNSQKTRHSKVDIDDNNVNDHLNGTTTKTKHPQQQDDDDQSKQQARSSTENGPKKKKRVSFAKMSTPTKQNPKGKKKSKRS